MTHIYLWSLSHYTTSAGETHLLLKKCVGKAFHNVCNDYLMLLGELKWSWSSHCHADKSIMKLRAVIDSSVWAVRSGQLITGQRGWLLLVLETILKWLITQILKEKKSFGHARVLNPLNMCIGWKEGAFRQREWGHKMHYSHHPPV